MTQDSARVSRGTAFNAEQFANIYPEGIEGHYWSITRNKIVYDVLRNCVSPEASVLDVGCGSGSTVDFLRRHGISCVGVDLALSPEHVRGKEYLTFGTDIEALPLEVRQSVSTVLLLDVIEHIETPGTLLQRLRETFPSMTMLVVTVPARMELWSNFDVFNGHFTRYDATSLRSVLSTAGYEVLTCRYLFHTLYVPARIMHLLGIQRPNGMTAPRGRFQKALHRILSVCFVLESALLPGGLPGSSLLAVAHV